jgi:hypothetical protein
MSVGDRRVVSEVRCGSGFCSISAGSGIAADGIDRSGRAPGWPLRMILVLLRLAGGATFTWLILEMAGESRDPTILQLVPPLPA